MAIGVLYEIKITLIYTRQNNSIRIIAKGKRDTREMDVHPHLKGFLEAYQADEFNPKSPYLFPGRWGP